MAHVNGAIAASALTPLSVGGHLLAAPAAAFEEWRRRAAAAGWVLTITSVADAYRALAVQERVFLQRYIPQATGGGIYGDVRWYRGVRYVRRHGASAAIPGTSNHGRGLAVDIANAGPFGGKFHNWMLATGPALGWSNTEGRSVGEPWHWVHDGVTLANASTDASTGLKPAPPVTLAPITTPTDFLEALMASTPIRFFAWKQGATTHIFEASLLAGTYRRIDSMSTLRDRKSVLTGAGIPWENHPGGSGDVPGLVLNGAAYGVQVGS